MSSTIYLIFTITASVGAALMVAALVLAIASAAKPEGGKSRRGMLISAGTLIAMLLSLAIFLIVVFSVAYRNRLATERYERRMDELKNNYSYYVTETEAEVTDQYDVD